MPLKGFSAHRGCLLSNQPSTHNQKLPLDQSSCLHTGGVAHPRQQGPGGCPQDPFSRADVGVWKWEGASLGSCLSLGFFQQDVITRFRGEKKIQMAFMAERWQPVYSIPQGWMQPENIWPELPLLSKGLGRGCGHVPAKAPLTSIPIAVPLLALQLAWSGMI